MSATIDTTATPGPAGQVDDVCPQWEQGFRIDGVAGGPLRLAQVSRRTFALTSRIEYVGETGLEDAGLPPDLLARIRVLDPSRCTECDDGRAPACGDPHCAPRKAGRFYTDLASVPGPTRWFLGAYGEHTPAALIHDWLIPVPPALAAQGLTEAHADRYLRFMCARLGMRWLKRWVMWAAVALRTRFAAGGWRRASVVAWLVAAVAGISLFATGFVQGVTGGEWATVWWSLGLAVASTPLWGRQWGAGAIAVIAAPWLLPPTVFAAAGYAVYWVLERAHGLLTGADDGDGDGPAPGTILPEGI